MQPIRSRRSWLLIVVLLTSVTISHQSHRTWHNDTVVSSPVYISPEIETKTVKVVQSFGVQSRSSNPSNEKNNQVDPAANSFPPYASSQQPVQSVIVSSNPNQNESRLGSHYGNQPNNFLHSQFLGFKPAQLQRPRDAQNVAIGAPGTHQNFPAYVPNAQRRVDSEVSEDDSEAYNEDEYEKGGYHREIQDNPNGAEIGYEDHYNYLSEGPKGEDGVEPETRQGGAFPVSGPGFIGPAPFDPLPPPPTQIKGSVDYILIPLVLIGIAGPIFVVLYVILGGFEAMLSPITRRSLGGFDAYQPYLDNLISSVGRALDTTECLDYATCQFGSFCNRLGYADTYPKIQETLNPFMPHQYKRRMRKMFSSMKNSENCSINNCIRLPSLNS